MTTQSELKRKSLKISNEILEIVNSYSLARDKIAAEHGNITYEYIYHKLSEDEFGYQPKIMKLMNPISPLEARFFLKF